MLKNSYKQIILFTVCLVLLCTQAKSLPFMSRKPTLLMIPARHRVIQLAFDIAKLRSVKIVSFSGGTEAKEPLLHLWVPSNWKYITVKDFSSGSVFREKPDCVIFIGEAQSFPSVLLHDASWCSNVHLIESLNIADLVNGLDRIFKFKTCEWKWLARRYELTLEDLNAVKRAQNPYDVKRSELPIQDLKFKVKSGDVPPAAIVEEEQVEK